MSNSGGDWALGFTVVALVGLALVSQYMTAEQSRECARDGGVWVVRAGCADDYCTAAKDAGPHE